MQSVQAILEGKHDETKHVSEAMSEEEMEQVKDAITDAQDFVRQNMEADPEEYTEAKAEAEKVHRDVLDAVNTKWVPQGHSEELFLTI